MGGGLAGAAASGALALLLAAVPGAGVGRALGRVLEDGAAEAVALALAGAAGGLALLDLLPFGAGWGEALLLLAGIGVSLPLRAPAGVEAGPREAGPPGPRRAALGACAAVCGASALLAAPGLLGYAAQFHPGRLFDHGAILVSLLVCGVVGAVGFGGLLVGRERLPAAFGFAGLAGGAAILSLSLVGKLAEPAFFQGYADLFARKVGAREGTFRFDAVFACGLGSLASFAAGASLRCGLGGSRGWLARPAISGCVLGILASPLLLSDGLVAGGAGYRKAIVAGALGLAAAGASGALLAPGSVAFRLVSALLPLAAAALAWSQAPGRIRIANPFNFIRVEVFRALEAVDGLATAASLPSGDPVARLDRAILANDGPSTTGGRDEIALSCALAERLDRVLLVGTPMPRTVALLRRAGARRVEAAPLVPAVGAAAQFFASREEERVAAIHRAPAGLAGPYDLVISLPEPAYLADAGLTYAAGRLHGLARLAGPRGLVAVWAEASSLAGPALDALADAAGEGLPQTFVAIRDVETVAVGFIGEAAGAAPDRLSAGGLYEEAGLLSASDVEGLRLGPRGGSRGLLSRVADAAGLRGPFPSFGRIAPAAWRPPRDRDIELPVWKPVEAGGAAALGRIAEWAGEGPLRSVLRGLAAHASSQVPSFPREPPLDQIEISPEEALRFVEAASCEIEPIARFVEGWGDLLLRKREYGEVHARFSEIVRRRPDRPGFLRILAAAELELLDPGGALEHLDRAFRAAPDDLGIVLLRARAIAEGGDRPKARSFLESLLERRPVEVRLFVALARLLGEMGETAAAREMLEAAERIAPDDPEVRRLGAEMRPR